MVVLFLLQFLPRPQTGPYSTEVVQAGTLLTSTAIRRPEVVSSLLVFNHTHRTKALQRFLLKVAR